MNNWSAASIRAVHDLAAVDGVAGPAMAQLEENLGAVALLDRLGEEELRALVEPFWADRDVTDPSGG